MEVACGVGSVHSGFGQRRARGCSQEVSWGSGFLKHEVPEAGSSKTRKEFLESATTPRENTSEAEPNGRLDEGGRLDSSGYQVGSSCRPTNGVLSSTSLTTSHKRTSEKLRLMPVKENTEAASSR